MFKKRKIRSLIKEFVNIKDVSKTVGKYDKCVIHTFTPNTLFITLNHIKDDIYIISLTICCKGKYISISQFVSKKTTKKKMIENYLMLF